MKIHALLISCLFSYALFAQPDIELQVFASGFNQPVDLASAGDERLFVVEKNGIIRILDEEGNTLPQAFLNIGPRVNSSAGERGLLGLTFHPDYENNGYFFVNYTRNDGTTRISRFQVSDNNANLADPGSELILLEVEQPFPNHNAGDLSFGPDGYLYFGLGDGGAGGDPIDAGQDRLRLLGKMIRIDVDNGNPYSIPPDNPFAEDDFTLDEIWALGLRNPWRFSFDRLTGDMWIADVGQNAFEEIDFQPAGSPGGENYGWRCYEGFEPFNLEDCPAEDAFTFPAHAYAHNLGCSVTGGYVYRGTRYPNIYGHYIYADFCSGRFWSLTPDGQGGWENQELLNDVNSEFVSFGEDRYGELYAAGISSGNIYRVTSPCEGPTVSITMEGNVLTATAGFESYRWLLNGEPIEGANGQSHTATESGLYTVQATNASGCTQGADAPVTIAVGVEEAIGLSHFAVSPNPFGEVFRVEIITDQPAKLRLKLLGLDGKQLSDQEILVVSDLVVDIPAGRLAKGVYLLVLEKEGKRVVKRIIKQ